jgi:hypothetical protein
MSMISSLKELLSPTYSISTKYDNFTRKKNPQMGVFMIRVPKMNDMYLKDCKGQLWIFV